MDSCRLCLTCLLLITCQYIDTSCKPIILVIVICHAILVAFTEVTNYILFFNQCTDSSGNGVCVSIESVVQAKVYY